MNHDDLGVLDEALIRLHETGPGFEGRLTNHGPMAVGARVHRRLDGTGGSGGAARLVRSDHGGELAGRAG